MKDTTRSHRKMVLLTLASVALLTPAVRAGTVSAQQDDLILGFRATGGVGAGVNLEVDLGSVSNFYNGVSSTLTLSNLVTRDLIDTYGANWGTRTDLFWGAAATDGNAQADPNGKPASTLWATGVPGNAAPLEGSSGLQAPVTTKIGGIYSGSIGSLDGATSTTNSSEAADINNTQTGSWSIQETSGNSFGFFSPKIDGQVSSVGTLDLYELQPSSTFPRPPGTLLGTLILTQSGLSFNVAVPDPFTTWQNQYFTASELMNPAFSGPGADPFGKGMSNSNQFLAGFNPTNATAYLHITSITRTNGGTDVRVDYLGASGDSSRTPPLTSRTNVLEFTTGVANGSYSSNNFVSTGQTNILSGGIGLGTLANMVDPGGATNKPARYYRVRVLLP
jgi:hypothetical protein